MAGSNGGKLSDIKSSGSVVSWSVSSTGHRNAAPFA